MLPWFLGVALAAPPDRAPIDATLDALHRAAADADAATYFGLFADDAVFIGTDAAEVWDLDAFRAFAAPHFEQAPAWAYTPVERTVSFDGRGRTAWFHEVLQHERYGQVRGSGVLVRDGGDWRVSQYVLSFPIPNDVAPAVIARIAAHEAGAPGPTLPTPFTAAQIAAACRPGTVIEDQTTTGDEVTRSRTTFVSGDGARVTLRFEQLDAEGEVLGEPQQGEASWADLRQHAAFPVDGTTWEDTEITVPLGTFGVRKYVVPRGDDLLTFWFAMDLPGPPVRRTVERDGEVVSETVMTSRSGPEVDELAEQTGR